MARDTKIISIYNTFEFHPGQMITWADEKQAPKDMEYLKRLIKSNIFNIVKVVEAQHPNITGHKQIVTFVCQNANKETLTYSGAYFKPFIESEDAVLSKAA